MLFGLPEMKVFAETSSDPRIKALWSRLKEARRKNALWCDEVNTLRDQLRWRDIKTESPTSDGRYLIVGEIGYVASDYFTLANGWTHMKMMLWTHWRPIGELPGDTE